MNQKVLFDTCVIVDVLQNRRHLQKRRKFCLRPRQAGLIDGYIAAKSVTDIYYLTHRITHNDTETRRILTTLLEFFAVADTAASDCLAALSSEMGDFEDAVLCETAKRCGFNCIVTRNIKDYKKTDVKVLLPEELVMKNCCKTGYRLNKAAF